MQDYWTERAVAVLLGLFSIIGLLELGWLVDHAKVSDGALLAIIATPVGVALGALSSLLSKLSGSSKPTEVEVVNPPSAPVPTEDV